MKTTIVTNVLTGEKEIFINNLSLSDNIISYIIIDIKKAAGQLTNKAFRYKVEQEAKITTGQSKRPGKMFAFSKVFDLHATTK